MGSFSWEKRFSHEKKVNKISFYLKESQLNTATTDTWPLLVTWNVASFKKTLQHHHNKNKNIISEQL